MKPKANKKPKKRTRKLKPGALGTGSAGKAAKAIRKRRAYLKSI